jgi:WD40 repeat protein/tetratricopeptide (TPR) repeat protein
MRMSPAPAKINPFPGLRPFTQEEDYLFFGREEQTIELLQRLGGNRFVAVVGTSGSGKSSLVRCGLLSELLGGRMLEAGASWEIAVAHPGGNPLVLLTDALLEADLYDRAQEHARENLLATLSRSHFGLVEAVKQADLGEGTNFLLVVDQFEEIFRFHEAGQMQQEAANEFVSLLLEAAAQKEVPIYVVLTMRSDFIGECGQFEGLAEMVNRGEFLIPRLNREQYKRVIAGPIKVAGGQIAPRLLQRLLNDLGQQADQLPCLQHALMRTWNVWAGNGNTDALDLDDYQHVGKMSQALSLHADEIYESLASDRQRALCQGIFQALTVEESNSRGIRRPQRLGRLCQILEAPADELLPIIDAYRQSGVTFLMPSPEVELTDQTILDISHESLMRVWTRLRQWVEEETQAAGIYHRLSESADLHERGKAGLYRDPELGIALAWRETKRPNAAWAERYRPGFATAMEFLEASQQASVAEEQSREAGRERELQQAQQLAEAQQLRLEHQQRAARKLRMMIGGLAVVATVAVLACVAALVANNHAKTLAGVASREAADARHQRKLAEDATRGTQQALTQVESQKAEVESSLTKAEKSEQVARAAEEAGRKLLYTTDMQLAPFLWRDDRTTAGQLRMLLAKHIPDRQAASKKPDLRGFEWHYYQHLLERSAAVFSGHAVAVVDGAFTSNGQLVTLDQSGQVRRWILGSEDENKASRRDLPGGPGAQVRALSPDGQVAALAEGNKVHVFDSSTGKETFQINSANVRSRRLIFSRAGDRLVIVDDKIRWCNAASGEVIASVDQKFDYVHNLALSADGLTLAVVGHDFLDAQFSIFRLNASVKTVTPMAKGDVGGERMIASALCSDGRLLAIGTENFVPVLVLDTGTGRQIAQHGFAHASLVSAMAFSGDSFKLATADVEGTIKIWEDARKLSSNSTASLTLKGHEAAITHVGFSSDGKQLVSTSADMTARVWDLEHTGAAIRVLERCGTHCYVARFSPDGQLIAAADQGNSVRLWDAATGKLVRELPAGDKGGVYSVAFSPTDHRVLAAGYGEPADVSHVSLWDIDAGTQLARLPGATDVPEYSPYGKSRVVGALAFSPDGKYLVAGFGSKNWFQGRGAPNPLKVWEVATRRLIRRLSGHTSFCVSLDFSQDGARLASGSRDGTAIIWSTETWKATQTLHDPKQGFVEDVAFSPDGKSLAMTSHDGSVLLWDVASGRPLGTLKGHASAVRAVAFSPDGRTLASGGTDHTVRLWNIETRLELMQLSPGGVELGHVQTLAFSPDAQRLLAGSDYGSSGFWSTAPVVWNDPDRAAEKLRLLLNSNADFQSRIRMLSEHLRLHAALAKLDAKDVRVSAALAAAQANWHASRQAWPEAALAFDRLVAADPIAPEAWLRTPGLLRLATALLHQNRPRDAAALLTGGAKRCTQDGVPAAVEQVGVGLNDAATGELLRPLRATINERLAREPRNPWLLELRAELAGQWSDTKAQLADYTAAIEALSKQTPAATTVDLKRLYARRGNAYIGSQQWQQALEDYARIVTDATTDDALLSNQALAQAEVLLQRFTMVTWTRLKPTEMKSTGGETLTIENDGSIFVSGPNPDRAVYTLKFRNDLPALTAIRLETIPDARLPQGGAGLYQGGAGRYPENGNFHVSEFTAAIVSGQADAKPTPIELGAAIADWQSSENETAKNMIDGNPNTRWATDPKMREAHWAVFGLKSPARIDGGSLSIRLDSGITRWGKHGLGRFRLSVSDDPAAFEREQQRFAAMKFTDPWQRLAAAYQLRGDQKAIDQLVQRRPKLAGRVGDLFIQDQDKDWPRAVEIYSRGIRAETTDVELLSSRARAYEALKNWAAAAADWSRAATGSPEGARLLAEFARRLAARDQVPLANGQFEKSQALYERLLDADPENVEVATELAQLLLDQHENGSLLDDPRIQEACRRAVEKRAGPNATASQGLLVALDQHRRGEKDQARRAYRQAVAAIQPVGENAFVRALLGTAMWEFGPDAPETEEPTGRGRRIPGPARLVRSPRPLAEGGRRLRDRVPSAARVVHRDATWDLVGRDRGGRRLPGSLPEVRRPLCRDEG